MSRPWSFSTTVRNPERLREFLRVLQEMEGRPFDTEAQVEYQCRLISRHLYRPVGTIPSVARSAFEDFEHDIPLDVARLIFDSQQYVDAAMRGRQSANPLNKLGLSVARDSSGPVRITPLGRKFLDERTDIAAFFRTILLKWQLPNPWENMRWPPLETDFSIVPLIATLHLLAAVEARSGRSDITQREFCLFVPTLLDGLSVPAQVDRLMSFRNAENRDDWERSFVDEFYGGLATDKQRATLYDYGDNTIRYFRLTKWIRVEVGALGGYWTCGLEPSRRVEIDQLLAAFDGQARPFASLEQWQDFMWDDEQPLLPWRQRNKLVAVAYGVSAEFRRVAAQEPSIGAELLRQPTEFDFDSMDEAALEDYVERVRDLINEARSRQHAAEMRHNVQRLLELARILGDRRRLRDLEPEDFERLLADVLLALDDAETIAPNYVADDGGQPIAHAPAGKPDIECFYESMIGTVEVTLDSSSMQWVREGQPVQRHLRGFEGRNPGKPAYCLFVAPSIHRDTYSTFYVADTAGYDGRALGVVPLSCAQLGHMLEHAAKMIERGSPVNQTGMHQWLQSVVAAAQVADGFGAWQTGIEALMDGCP